jgi:uncharacterized protein (DUF1684 family)
VTRSTRLLLAASLAAVLAGCNRQPAEDTPKMDATAVAFQHEEDAWRAQRRATLLKPDGWTSLIGLHWIEPGAHYLGSDADNGIRLAMGPAHLGMLELRDGAFRFVPDKEATLLIDGQPPAGPVALRPDTDLAGPSVIAFDDGKGSATVIERAGRHALRVRHADAPTRVHFSGLEYWPAEQDWKVSARFIPHEAGRTMEVANIIGGMEPIANPGVVEFEREGKVHRLEAFDEGEGTLFLVFADRTSGKGSYGAGRFLDAPMPDAQGRVTLDFNQARNPPCAFTAFATCPLPPPENRLDLAITAGEKAYRKPDHS